MTRSVAVRASVSFSLFAVAFASVGLASGVGLSELLFLISASMCALMMVLAVAAPVRAPVLVPVRSRRR